MAITIIKNLVWWLKLSRDERKYYRKIMMSFDMHRFWNKELINTLEKVK